MRSSRTETIKQVAAVKGASPADIEYVARPTDQRPISLEAHVLRSVTITTGDSKGKINKHPSFPVAQSSPLQPYNTMHNFLYSFVSVVHEVDEPVNEAGQQPKNGNKSGVVGAEGEPSHSFGVAVKGRLRQSRSLQYCKPSHPFGVGVEGHFSSRGQ